LLMRSSLARDRLTPLPRARCPPLRRPEDVERAGAPATAVRLRHRHAVGVTADQRSSDHSLSPLARPASPGVPAARGDKARHGLRRRAPLRRPRGSLSQTAALRAMQQRQRRDRLMRQGVALARGLGRVNGRRRRRRVRRDRSCPIPAARWWPCSINVASALVDERPCRGRGARRCVWAAAAARRRVR
jgi:hypothetical protein